MTTLLQAHRVWLILCKVAHLHLLSSFNHTKKALIGLIKVKDPQPTKSVKSISHLSMSNSLIVKILYLLFKRMQQQPRVKIQVAEQKKLQFLLLLSIKVAKIVYKFTITSTHCLTAKIIVLQELSTIKIKAKVQVEAKLSSAIAFLYNKTPVKSISCSNNTLLVARNRHQRSKAQSTWPLIKTTSYNQVRLRARKLCKWLCQVTTTQHNSASKVILWQK